MLVGFGRYGHNCHNYHPTAAEFAAAARRASASALPAAATVAATPPSPAAAVPPALDATRAAASAQLPDVVKQQQRVQALQFASAAVAAASTALAQGAAIAPRPPGPLSPTLPAAPRALPDVGDTDVHVETYTTPNGVLMARIGSNRAVPLRPGSGVCLQFMQQGACKWGRHCRHHHPIEKVKQELIKLQVGAAGRPQGAAGGLDARAGSGGGATGTAAATAEDTAAQQVEGGWRSAEPGTHVRVDAGEAARAQSVTGEAANDSPSRSAGAGGYVIHQHEISGRQYVVAAAGVKLPVNPRASACANLLRTGQCRFGMKCRYNHSPQMLAAWDMKTQQKSAGGVEAGADGGLQEGRGVAGMQQDRTAAAAATGNSAASGASAVHVQPASSAAAAGPTAPTVEALVDAVSKLWPQPKHGNPEVWAAHQMVLYLVLQAGHFAYGRSINRAASPLLLDALLAQQPLMSRVRVTDADAQEGSMLLAR